MKDARVLRRARLAAGLSYREVAQAARLDPSSIAHYEAHRMRPSAAAQIRWQGAIQSLLQERQAAILDSLAVLDQAA